MRTSRSKTRTKSPATIAPSRTRATRFRTTRTTSRYALKARSPTSRAKVRRTSTFGVRPLIVRTQKPRRQTCPEGFWNSRSGCRPNPVYPRRTTTKTAKPRTPRTIFKSSVWSQNPPRQLRVKTHRRRAPTPTKITRRTPLYEPRKVTLSQELGSNPMINSKQRYLRPMEKDLYPRPQYQAFADSEPSITDRLSGVLSNQNNMGNQFSNLLQSPMVLYGGIALVILIILKVLL